jgi:hypothetical protein
MKQDTGKYFDVPDGLSEVKSKLPLLIELITQTARWVHPDTFHALPIWYPEFARGQQLYDAAWTRQRTNTSKRTGRTEEKFEANEHAGKTLIAALGTRKADNWTVCHIWGYDDPKFFATGDISRDPRFYSCTANMIWLPTPLKGFTDAVPTIKRMLRTCAFYLYGWVCEHSEARAEAEQIQSGFIPEAYPDVWPAPGRTVFPPGTAPFSPRVVEAVEKRKGELRRRLGNPPSPLFPLDQVKEVLDFWKVRLDPQ